jgi:tetratricopeptide (TPR) repeat protein
MLLAPIAAAMLLGQSEECAAAIVRARQAYEAKAFAAAEAEFVAADAICPRSAALLTGMAQSQVMQRRLADAVRSLDRALAIDPTNVATLKVKGDALYLAGDEVNAEKALLAARAIDPAAEPVLYALGRIYYQQNRYAEAVQLFQQILERDPLHYRAHDNLALCYEALNQDELALQEYLKTLDLVHKDHPEYDWVYGNVANFFLRRDQNEKAFQAGVEAARRNPNSARNFFLTGKALFKLEKYPQSTRWLEQAIRLDPLYQEAHYVLAQVYRKQGRPEDADRELAVFRKLSTNARTKR